MVKMKIYYFLTHITRVYTKIEQENESSTKI